jgi:tRNA pseudouridine13 synthase
MSAELPFLCAPPTAPLPAARFKEQPDDFVVEEVPLYQPSGSGTHTYLWIEKRGLNSLDATRILAAHFGTRGPDAGLAGMKDAQAVTRQWVSVEHIRDAAAKIASFAHPQIRILDTRQHGNKLRMGHLRGNRFRIRLRVENDSDAGVLALRSETVLTALAKSGIANFYGEQRFGRGGNNVALGRLLVRGDRDGFEKACADAGMSRPSPRLRNLIVNAFQSDLFNRILSRRMPRIGELQAGDLAQLHRNGAVFAIAGADDAAREQPRADAFEISPSGPLFGPKSPLAEGEPGVCERAVLNEAEVTVEDFGRREAGQQQGARRPLRIAFLEAPAVEREADGVVLVFALPAGSYATVVVREILGGRNTPVFAEPA